MTRKRVTLAYISNEVERKASYRKRKKGMMKKVRELSILCGIQACAIIYSPYDPEPEVWPSRAGTLAVLARFRRLSDVERSMKAVNQESFTMQRIKKAEDQLLRTRRENKRLELENFMFRCMARVDSLQNFDLRDSAEMGLVVNQALRDITARMETLKINGQDKPAPPPAVVPVMGEESSSSGYLLEHICGISMTK